MFDLKDLPSPMVVTEITKAQFERDIQPLGVPVVIKGFAKNWPIVEASKQSHDMLKYLEQSMLEPDKIISVTRIPKSEKSRMFYNQAMTAMNFGVAQLPLSNCLNRMQHDTLQADYAAQCVRLNDYFPDLLKQINNPLIDSSVSPFIWFGNRVVVAPHFDESDNIAVVAAGKRRFTLFPPVQTPNLYIGPLEFTPAGQPISLVNILEPDINQHPKYPKAYEAALSVELAPGDAIHIPTPWWHHVQSLADFNVLMNYWWNQSDLGTAKPFAAILHAMQAFRHLPISQKQHFAALLQYYALEETEHSHEHLPKHAKGWLGPDSQRNRLEIEHFIREFSK